jgi:2-iminobutanoate/2-iminopropanoate deaminase
MHAISVHDFLSLMLNSIVMKKEIIHTPNAPAPIGPYSQAVAVGHILYISGQIAINPITNEVNHGPLDEQARMVMRNLEAILSAAGTSFAQVIKTSIFLAPGEDFATVNEIYGKHFDGDYPARETVWVRSLPKGVKVEISMVALIPAAL